MNIINNSNNIVTISDVTNNSIFESNSSLKTFEPREMKPVPNSSSGTQLFYYN